MKKMISQLMMVAGVLLVSSGAHAHSGHDHDGPAGVKAPKGGIVRGIEKVHFELVAKAKDLKIYVYDEDMKPRKTEGLTVSAIAELPRKKGSAPISLADKGDFYEAQYDAKGIHRYTLILSVNDSQVGHDDQVKFTVEPRK